MLRSSNSDRLLLGSPLRQRRFARVVLGVLLVLLTFAILQILGVLARLKPDAVQVFFLALLISSILALMPIAILRFLDRRERESFWVSLAAFLWGGVIATGISLPLNTAILISISDWIKQNPVIKDTLGPQAALLIGAPIAGPLVEETFKALGVLLFFLLLRAEFDNVRDGFIYGALVGVGFNWLESALYVAQNYAQFGFAPWGLQLGGRYSLFGMAGHTLYTGIFGAFLGLTLQIVQAWWRYLLPLVGLLLAIAAHAFNNVLPLVFTLAASSAGTSLPTNAPPPNPTLWQGWLQKSLLDLVLFIPFLLLVIVLLWRSGIWERRVIRDELREEVGQTITPEEFTQVERDSIFRTRRISMGDRRLAAALVNAQHELAFRKHRVRQTGGDPNTDPLVTGWRNEIAQLRTALHG